MTLYDFDKTVYHGDCTVNFWKHCVLRKPYLALFIPIQAFFFLLFKLGFKSREFFKEKFLFFIKHFKDIDAEVGSFWEKEEKNLCKWFTEAVSADDIVISASPEFLVRPMTDKYGIRCIASVVDKKTAKFLSPNCKGENKVRRLTELGITAADLAYSDSESDLPMLSLAKTGYIIKNVSQSEMKIIKKYENRA